MTGLWQAGLDTAVAGRAVTGLWQGELDTAVAGRAGQGGLDRACGREGCDREE